MRFLTPVANRNDRGFTLMELLIVVALLVLLLLILLMNLRNHFAKGRDTQRKTDLAKIQKAFEEYYNDKACYYASSPLTGCGGPGLAPYIPRVPCDPGNKGPYLYVAGTPTACDGYHVCAKLEDLSDPDIKRIGCDPVQGCGWGAGYNYCVAMGSDVVAPNFVPGAPTGTPTPTPTNVPTPTPPPGGTWECRPNGDCNNYADPVGAGCPYRYSFGCIYNGVYQCADPANRCVQ